jgi:hypothetical protein
VTVTEVLRICIRFARSAYLPGDDPLTAFLLELTPLVEPAVQAEKVPADIVLVLDASGSMNAPDRFPLVEGAARLFVEHVDALDRVAIVLFSKEAQTVSGLVPGRTLRDTWNSVRSLVGRSPVYFGGGTFLGRGLAHALAELKLSGRPGAARRTYVLTDGELHDVPACEALAAHAAAEGVELHVYGFGRLFDPEQLCGIVRGIPGGAVKPLIDTERVTDTFLHLAGVSRRIVVRDLRVLVRFAADAIPGDAFRFRPQERHLGPVRDNEWTDTIPAVETRRTYSYLLEVRLPAGAEGRQTVGIVSTTCEHGGAVRHQDARIEALRAAGEATADPAVERSWRIVAGLRDGDPDVQLAALTARIDLCRAEGRDPALVAALERRLAQVRASPAAPPPVASDIDRKYLACDMSSQIVDLRGMVAGQDQAAPQPEPPPAGPPGTPKEGGKGT